MEKLTSPEERAPEPTEPAPETSERRTERMQGQLDSVFEDLVGLAAQSPEAQRAAVQAVVASIHQTAEQLSQVRDAKHIHELKKLMLKHWQELQELTKGNPAQLKQIQEWGKRFVEGKIIFMQAIEEVKDEMADKAQDVQAAWNAVQNDLGRAAGLIGTDARIALERFWKQYGLETIERFNRSGEFRGGPGLDRFLESMTSLETGFARGDIDTRAGAEFLEKVNELLSELNARAAEASTRTGIGGYGSEGKEHAASAMKLLDGITEKMDGISKAIREASKIFKVVKRLREESFLPLYAEGPEIIAPAA